MRFNAALLRPPSGLFPYSAALSFYSVLNLIPLLYIGFFIFSKTPSFGQYASKAKEFLIQMILPTASANDLNVLDTFVQSAANLDSFGFLALLFAIFSAFVAYEKIICLISKTPRRSLLQAIALYWALTTLAPLALGISFYISFKIQSQLGVNLLSLLPFFIIWAMFLSSYYFSINANLNAKFSILISFFAALIWSGFKWLFLWYLSVSSLASIYGGFSAVFVFFLWLYFSWIVFLYSAALCARICKAESPQPNEIKVSKNVRSKRRN